MMVSLFDIIIYTAIVLGTVGSLLVTSMILTSWLQEIKILKGEENGKQKIC